MSKQNDILNYINTIEGATVSTSALCKSCNCTLPTVLSFIKNNPSRFEKVARGQYRIMPTSASNVMTASQSNVTNLPTHEW